LGYNFGFDVGISSVKEVIATINLEKKKEIQKEQY
jgi:hypothetical protein